MKFLRKHWYDVCGVSAVFSSALLVIFGEQMDTLRILLALNFIVVLLHQFEEYRFPGGGQAIANAFRRGEIVYDRYPLNQNNAMWGNLIAAFGFYLLPVFFPEVLWLGIAPVIFGLIQIIPHVFIANIGLRTWYNPGFFSVVFGHVPVGIYYLYYIVTNNSASTQDWIIGAVYVVLFLVVSNALFYKLLADKNSQYPFPEEELNRFHMLDKVRTLEKNK